MSATKRVKLEDNDFTLPWDQSDVTFEVETRRLYFNRAVLAFHSEVFDRMFNSEFRESDPQKVIPLPEKKFEDVQAMLFVLKASPNLPYPITEANLLTMLAMSDEYKMHQLGAECGKFILLNWKADSNKHLKAVSLAFEYGLRAVAETFLPLAACRTLAEIDAAAGEMPMEVHLALLHGKLFIAQHAAARTNYYSANDRSAVQKTVTEIPNCSDCKQIKFGVATPQCLCPKKAPFEDAKIKWVLTNFAEICRMKKK